MRLFREVQNRLKNMKFIRRQPVLLFSYMAAFYFWPDVIGWLSLVILPILLIGSVIWKVEKAFDNPLSQNLGVSTDMMSQRLSRTIVRDPSREGRQAAEVSNEQPDDFGDMYKEADFQAMKDDGVIKE